MRNRCIQSIALLLIMIVSVVLVAWRYWDRANAKPVSESLHQKIKAIVDKKPAMRPAYEKAMSDGILTLGEADALLKNVNEPASE